MLLYKGAGTLAMQDPGDFRSNLVKRQTELRQQVDEEIRVRFRRDPKQLPHAVRAPFYYAAGRRVLLEHPIAFAELAARGIGKILLGFGGEAVKALTGVELQWALPFLGAYTGLCLLLALVGLYELFRNDPRLALLITLILTYFIILPAGAESYSRFRVPIMPMYAMATAMGVYFLRNRFMVRCGQGKNASVQVVGEIERSLGKQVREGGNERSSDGLDRKGGSELP